MAFGKKKNLIEQLETELKQKDKELAEISPYIDMAKAVKAKLAELLEMYKSVDLSKLDIAQMAYETVLEVETERARQELAERYKREHRELLAAKILELTELEEGETISQKAARVIETDPAVALELRESARKQLIAKYQAQNAVKLEAQQAEYVEAELDRKLKQDRLDVQFALQREVDLTVVEGEDMFKPGDTLGVQLSSIKHWGNEVRGVNFEWQKDAKGREGWVVRGTFGTSDSKVIKHSQGKGPEKLFVTIGSMCPDLETGVDVFVPDKLIAGMPLAVGYTARGAETITPITAIYGGETVTSGDYYNNYKSKKVSFDIEVAMVDFEIRPLLSAK